MKTPGRRWKDRVKKYQNDLRDGTRIGDVVNRKRWRSSTETVKSLNDVKPKQKNYNDKNEKFKFRLGIFTDANGCISGGGVTQSDVR